MLFSSTTILGRTVHFGLAGSSVKQMFAAIGLATLLASPESALRWSPKQGDRLAFEYRLETTSEPKMQVVATLESEVQAVTQDGYITRTLAKDALVILAGQEIRDQRNKPIVAQFTSRGSLLRILEGQVDPGSYDLGRFTKFVAPEKAVAKGAKWTIDYPSLPGGVSAHRIEFRVVDLVAELARVEFSIKATAKDGFTGKGVWLLNAQTGEVDGLEGEATNAGGSAAGGFKISMKRIRR